MHLVGREIEPDLAAIANALLRRMLVYEFQVAPKFASRLTLVKVGDSLDPKFSSRDDIDHEVGNPPFLRLGGADKRLSRPIFGEIASGRVNLYALFVRRALEEVPIGGMIGYVIPASFLGGPEFASFRKRVLQLAEVLVVDLIEKRSDVFLDAIQDACFVVLRRRVEALVEPPASVAASGVFRRDGKFISKDVAQIEANGAPWRLPGDRAGTFIDAQGLGVSGDRRLSCGQPPTGAPAQTSSQRSISTHMGKGDHSRGNLRLRTGRGLQRLRLG